MTMIETIRAVPGEDGAVRYTRRERRSWHHRASAVTQRSVCDRAPVNEELLFRRGTSVFASTTPDFTGIDPARGLLGAQLLALVDLDRLAAPEQREH